MVRRSEVIVQLFYWIAMVLTYSFRITAATNESSELLVNKTVSIGKVTFNFEAHYLNTLQHKLDSITDVLAQVDSSVKNLQEKAHTWAIFYHHIDSWNDQLKTLEHKMDLIKRAQEEQPNLGHKLTSLELSLNHILSKVIYLSDSCESQPHAAKANNMRAPSFEELLQKLQRSNGEDKKMRNEILVRLTNILHRVQKIESGSCHGARGAKENGSSQKMARIMQPVGGCNASQRYNYNIEQSLKAMELTLKDLMASVPPKDFKHIYALSKKNAHSLEEIVQTVTQTEAALVQWREIEENQTRNINEYCQDVMGELTTLTESSDYMLKKVEKVVGEVNVKLSRIACVGATDSSQDSEVEIDSKEHGEDQQGSGTDNDVSYSTEAVESFEVDTVVDVKDMDEEDSINANRRTGEIDFVQPSKSGCHELTERVDGIYKFATPEINDAERDFNERYCAFATAGAAWTVIQNRGAYSPEENFNRSWADYRTGFGHLDADFWFGNEFIHQLVYRDDYALRIEMQDFDDVSVWAEYSVFRVDSERYNYNLLIGGYRGAVPDAMQYHNEQDFSTYDRRNDKSVDACCACATGYASGWWFDNCSEANLNGIYHDSPTGHNYVGIIWEHWHGDYSLKRARMLIRPNNAAVAGSMPDIYNEFNEDP